MLTMTDRTREAERTIDLHERGKGRRFSKSERRALLIQMFGWDLDEIRKIVDRLEPTVCTCSVNIDPDCPSHGDSSRHSQGADGKGQESNRYRLRWPQHGA